MTITTLKIIKRSVERVLRKISSEIEFLESGRFKIGDLVRVKETNEKIVWVIINKYAYTYVLRHGNVIL